ncbi:MAG TPA: type II secretion system F family protein [Bryobacteraceae bacterium]|jgi:type IV pilus assembly protein PilC|nr:type II secretion system F family protein [Bryobacteraceae bacterium]
MAEWTLKYADARGEIHQQVAQAASEGELRDRFTQQGFLVYSVKPRSEIAGLTSGLRPTGKKLNLEKFLIFNQQFVTLVRAGLPILKALDLLAERLTDPKLSKYISNVREEVRSGALLSEAFARQGVFPPIYVTSVLAGERSGSLAEVIERFITYQKLALSVRKKLLLSLLYPALLVSLVICLIVFLITFVVPNFAGLYQSMQAQLPAPTLILIAIGTTARSYVLLGFGALVVAILGFRAWSRTPGGRETVDRVILRIPIAGEVWLKYQVAQFSRVLSTLLIGGIPLMQALDTAADSLGTEVLKKVLVKATKLVQEGQSLSGALRVTKVFPSLSLDMIEVGESTGALPAMLGSVAEFYEDDVSTRVTAALSLIEPVIMIFMGIFVAFVLISLYLPIFSLADSIHS